MIGAEIGGAVKNVYAIAAGIVAGKKFGASAHAALVTRSFAEMMRFGAALGARRETLTGLSGLGDLVLTCGSPQSRNMSLGIELGKGKSLDEVLGKRLAVTEGVYTAGALVEMAAARGIDMPIAQAVHAVISGLATVDEAIEALLARPLRAEAVKVSPCDGQSGKGEIASSPQGTLMLYALICTDKPDGLPVRMANRPDHVAYLQSLGDTLVFAGPFSETTARP